MMMPMLVLDVVRLVPIIVVALDSSVLAALLGKPLIKS
jgi:hypothetical protein